MASTIAIKITNLAKIKAAFNKAPNLMVKELDLAIKKSAFTIQRQSMINAPVLTGRLRASHRTIFEPLSATIYPNVDYAQYVHDGTRYMPGRPFLFNAVQTESQTVQDFFTNAVNNVLSQIGRAT